MKKNLLIIGTLILIITILSEGCFYHKADQEYPATAICDTINIQYSVEIKSILNANCSRCHNGESSISGIDLYNHATIAALALDGKFTYGTLLSAVKHEGGAAFMPDDAPRLQDCDINKIAAWVHSGAPNN